MNRLSVILVFLLLTQVGFLGFSAEPPWQDSLKLDNEKMQKASLDWSNKSRYLNDPAFRYLKPESESNLINEIREFISDLWESFWNWLLPEQTSSGKFPWLIQLLIKLGLFLLIIWLLVKGALNLIPQKEVEAFRGSGIFKSKAKGSEPLEQLLDAAVKDKKFEVAIRYQYLLLLQNLASAGRIVWQEPKTNTDYWTEIKEPNLKGEFQRVSYIYECIWYGEYKVDEKGYRQLSKAFDQVKALL